MRFKKIPVEVEAYQWFTFSPYVEGVKRDVDYYRHPNIDGGRRCNHCSKIMHVHGWIDTLEGGHIVCPGDWVITGVKGEKYPCKPDIFDLTYEAVSPVGADAQAAIASVTRCTCILCMPSVI